ncbi:MAG: pyruvate dehydrogenase (acetyl-transferring) E1 component subunit alpha [Deltaproteobacteria bacterium RIFOXYB2_FULL_66_7]|nr:MAG: pyruvate dehydrogenase (acetyl-transferring) E1 component subunit alpha [Deltaproteobacteria bacterium RIFOXYB2_FULL_66_7]
MASTSPSRVSVEDAAGINVTAEEALDWFRKMSLIRRFEERAEEAYGLGKIGGFLHLYIGEEAIAVGAMAALLPEDDVITHYRDHGYVLARGIDPKRVMAELYGKATGLSKGKGGSMHMADVRRHLWGGYAIVGGHIPLATGLALANQYRKVPQVVACFFGEGATNTGSFYAALNLAAVWKLPLIAIVENNRYGMGTAFERVSAVGDVYRKASAFDILGMRIDGNDVLAVRDAVRRMADRSRTGGGPQLIEAMTYRFRGHSMGDPQRYRTKEEVEEAKASDPIVRWKRTVLENDLATEDELRKIVDEVDAEVEEAVRFAENSPVPDPGELCNDVLVAE